MHFAFLMSLDTMANSQAANGPFYPLFKKKKVLYTIPVHMSQIRCDFLR